MFELLIKFRDDDGPSEIHIEGDRYSFGRGSDADRRFDDTGLSRLHATIYREGDKVWIVDENSSNGTFVNGQRVSGGGLPLKDGDSIRIGHETELKVEFRTPEAEPSVEESAQGQTVSSAASEGSDRASMVLPLAILGVAILLIGVSAIFIGVKVIGGRDDTVASDTFDDYGDDDTDTTDNGSPEGTDDAGNGGSTGSQSPSPSPAFTPDVLGTPVYGQTGGQQQSVSPGKTYQQMSDAEKNQYIRVKADVVSRVIGNSSGEAISPEAAAKIRQFLDGYVRRIRPTRKDDCSMRGWGSSDMSSVLLRAKGNAPFIIKAFNDKGIDPQVGLYLAMIESEHCECLQSPTGPLGMFQFTQATAKRYGLDVRSGASPSNPDERCMKEPAAKAAASYMKALTGRIGTGPLSIPLAIASYNSGEGGLGKNLRTALEANESQERSFWTLVANSEKLAEQFQRENIKYVPKFFAAAIIGENPKDFGVDLLPLSLYTN